MIIQGLVASLNHPENGMSELDMRAAATVADRYGEVIIFRSTGPWSRRLIERAYPTKNFHVKGKSSDWGPQAGMVPYEGIYSKVGHSAADAAEGTKQNQKGLDSGFANYAQLALSADELQSLMEVPCEQPPRTALLEMVEVQGDRFGSDGQVLTKDRFLIALRSGDNKRFAFRAEWSPDIKKFLIWVFGEGAGTNVRTLPFSNDKKKLLVMTSSERGANNMPMTGDYDLMAICPKWGDYGSGSVRDYTKPDLILEPTGKKPGVKPGLTFAAGTNMDKVLDMRLNTGVPGKVANLAGGKTRKQTFQGNSAATAFDEHPDFGNVTPRILRCINALNAAMPNGAGALRRVHHNAESHRNFIFGALTADKMRSENDGFPLTVFQPRNLNLAICTEPVATLETYQDFKDYVTALNQAGYFVPLNAGWGMSLRD